MMAMGEPIPPHKKPARPTANEAVQAAERDAVRGRGGGEVSVIGIGMLKAQTEERFYI
jgi:hypothetical protein